MEIRDPNGILGTQFTCPTCGSHFFGTNIPAGERYCKGHYEEVYNDYTGCDFRWPTTDDDKYFAPGGPFVGVDINS